MIKKYYYPRQQNSSSSGSDLTPTIQGNEIVYTTYSDEPIEFNDYSTVFDGQWSYNTSEDTGNAVYHKYVFSTPVTTINASAFENNQDLCNIWLPEGITTIGNSVFKNSKLQRIFLPNTLSSLGTEVFMNSSLLYLFLPNSVTQINTRLCSGCIKLRSISFGLYTTIIKESAFENCWGLSIIEIPNSVTTLEEKAFRWCYGVIKIIIGNSVNALPESVFQSNHCTEIIIPDSVMSISQYAFANCQDLRSVYIGNNVRTIAYLGFNQCDNLETIQLNSNYISGMDFYQEYLSALEVPYDGPMPQYSEYRDMLVFANALQENYTIRQFFPNVHNIEFGTSIRKIGSNFCGNCILYNVSFSTGLTEIGRSAFEGCKELETITFPNTLQTIGNFAFNACYKLATINFGTSVQNIGEGAFRLTSPVSITLPDTVTTIGIQAFNRCGGLTSINIPNSVSTIPNELLGWDTDLNIVTIGSGTTLIKKFAFTDKEQNVNGLCSPEIIICYATTPPRWEEYGEGPIYGGYSNPERYQYSYPQPPFGNANLRIYVPANSVNSYKTAPVWSAAADKIYANLA